MTKIEQTAWTMLTEVGVTKQRFDNLVGALTKLKKNQIETACIITYPTGSGNKDKMLHKGQYSDRCAYLGKKIIDNKERQLWVVWDRKIKLPVISDSVID